ncbi:META domain-containing protein [Roseobacter ponti]|uniref:META domain-containing protein n=1 Tax=Roseobacter ponti TaxID=1891787 RepID=A0A858SXM4_9RHOB|nr:META domain-containing protein [Roseobacter ponti]QJF51626.1 META domain-containing protein [Roseobacter ponti]
MKFNLPVFTAALLHATQVFAADWRIISINGAPAIGDPAISFLSDGSISGGTGCNRFSATGQTSGDRLIVSGPVATTRMGCDGDALLQQEAMIVALVESGASVTADVFADTLTLTDVNSTFVLKRTAAPAPHN